MQVYRALKNDLITLQRPPKLSVRASGAELAGFP